MDAVTKNSKKTINFIFRIKMYNYIKDYMREHQGDLGIRKCRKKKKKIRSGIRSQFCSDANISRKHECISSDLIRMHPEFNYFKCIQMSYPRWPPGTVTKYNINRK